MEPGAVRFTPLEASVSLYGIWLHSILFSNWAVFDTIVRSPHFLFTPHYIYCEILYISCFLIVQVHHVLTGIHLGDMYVCLFVFFFFFQFCHNPSSFSCYFEPFTFKWHYLHNIYYDILIICCYLFENVFPHTSELQNHEKLRTQLI